MTEDKGTFEYDLVPNSFHFKKISGWWEKMPNRFRFSNVVILDDEGISNAHRIIVFIPMVFEYDYTKKIITTTEDYRSYNFEPHDHNSALWYKRRVKACIEVLPEVSRLI